MEKIILDLFGGDNSVDVLIVGAYEALSVRSDLFITFVGPYEVLAARLNQHPEFEGRYEIVDCPNILDNNLNPLVAVRTGEPFSLIKGCELLASTDAKSYVSVGSTGSLIVSSLVKVGLNKNAHKPVLGALLPDDNKGGRFLLVDCGSNLAPTVEDYDQYALLGAEYMMGRGLTNPRVAMLNVGSEEGKGTTEMVAASALIRESGINFVGNVEPDHIFEDRADVYICSGLVGNALLKGLEAQGRFLVNSLGEKIFEGLDEETKAKVASRIDDLGQLYKYNDLAGAVILGIKKPIIKAHGKADASTILNCLLQALGC
ncbi:MAG: hypothetical protein IKZ29_00270 [Clostridiales bacterium]|nr:hypothetical protein [Clostridiales bacterium]